ncbi:MAG: site-specific DNA-methyltransferase [Chloroflexota bacterium]|jgi:DNA modification methylase
MSSMDHYVTDDAQGHAWRLMLGDSCERLAELDAESIDLSVYSPPFASLYTYSPTSRDLGNSHGREEFLEHYGYVVREVLRLTKPGRLSCVHVQQLTTTKATHGIVGMTDFRGQVIQAHQDAGWIYHGEVTVDKDPQAQAIRTKAQALMFNTLHRDSAMTRPALADYVIVFRAPGENRVPIQSDVDNETWIEWARPVWLGIRETDTLNERVAREAADERHVCPLQLPLIERCVRLWSNKGETVLSPFAGIGSEGVVAVRQGRRFVGCELKASYWKTACEYLAAAEQQLALDVAA